MALKSSVLIDYLKKNPEAWIRFVEQKDRDGECTVSITDFAYDAKRGVFVLPNLCQCQPVNIGKKEE